MLHMGVTGVWVCCPPAYYRRHNMKQPANTVCLNLEKSAINFFRKLQIFLERQMLFKICSRVEQSQRGLQNEEFLFYNVFYYRIRYLLHYFKAHCIVRLSVNEHFCLSTILCNSIFLFKVRQIWRRAVTLRVISQSTVHIWRDYF